MGFEGERARSRPDTRPAVVVVFGLSDSCGFFRAVYAIVKFLLRGVEAFRYSGFNGPVAFRNPNFYIELTKILLHL